MAHLCWALWVVWTLLICYAPLLGFQDYVYNGRYEPRAAAITVMMWTAMATLNVVGLIYAMVSMNRRHIARANRETQIGGIYIHPGIFLFLSVVVSLIMFFNFPN